MNPLEQVKKALDEAIAQKKLSQDLLRNLGPAIIETIQPVLDEIAINTRLSKEELLDALSQLNINIPQIEVPHTTVDVKIPDIIVPEPKVTVNIPEIKLPDFPKIPEIKVPKAEVKVTIPPIKIPDLKWPEEEMPIKGWVSLMGVDMNNPLPVQIRDSKGNPINLFENLTSIIGGGSGGKSDFFTIKGFSQSAYSEVTNPDGRLRVSVETGGSGITDAELRATSVPVSQVSGSIWSTYVTGAGQSTYAEILNPDGRVKVELPTGSSGLTDTELRATAVPVSQVSGSIWSTEATQAGTWNIGTVTTVIGISNSVAASLIDSSGVQYSGSNPVPVSGIVTVSGSISSTVVSGTTTSDAIDDGSAPIKTGGIARTANPTAVAGGDTVSASYDKLGRQLTRIQARDLISTAYVSITNGTETTLKAGVAGSYLDLIYMMGTNNSDAAITVDIRAVTAGNIQTSVRIPANGTAGVALPTAIPQDETGNNWTADLPDVTGTTVTLSALFSKEI